MKRALIILIAVFVGGVLAAAFASSSKTNFDGRWTAAHDDLIAVQANISEEKLHTRALEILRETEAM